MEIKDVGNLAGLVRIELEEDEKKEILQDMKEILEYVKIIESVKTEETESEYSNYNVWRDDTLDSHDFSSELILKQFPDAQDGFLKVKKIL